MPSETGDPVRRPFEPGFFTVPDDPAEPPRLLGSTCPSCGETFYPRRLVCAKCLHEGCDDVELGPDGRLFASTWVHVPMFGKADAGVEGYAVGQVDLPEGPRVQSVLTGEAEGLTPGRAMTLELEILRTDRDGDEVVIYRFRPADGPEGEGD